MPYTPTLEEVAGNVKSVYVDTSVLVEHRMHDQGHVMPERIVDLHLAFVERLEQMVAAQPNILSVPEIIAEYNKLVSLAVQKLFQRPEKGMRTKAQLLAVRHYRISKSLRERGEYGEREEALRDFFVDQRLHLPRTSLFLKKNIQGETSRGDASLVSAAILDAGSDGEQVAIVTGDNDLVNLVMNFARLYEQGFFPQILVEKRPRVNVYFPALREWRERLVLEYMI